MDSTADAHSADETDFLLFLNGLIAYADENDPENTSEDFAFYRSGEEGAKDVPALLRIYQGKYERPIQSSATNILTNAGIRLPEPEPAAAFADLKSLRALESLLKDAEETDKTFEADPDYTIALFDSEGALMEKEVSPLLLWIHDGHLYFKTAPEAKIMRAAVKPDGLTEFLESFKNKA